MFEPLVKTYSADNFNRLRLPAEGDVGYDLRCVESFWLLPLQRKLINTGIQIEMSEMWVREFDGQMPYFAIVAPRSSMNVRGVNSAIGIVDPGYRGPIKVVIHNTTLWPQRFHRGDKIAQLVFLVNMMPELQLALMADELSPTERGEKGFGSTGR